MRYIIIILLFLLAFSCHAAIYMQTDKNGHVSYSDTPTSNATEIIPHASGFISTPTSSQPSSSAGNAIEKELKTTTVTRKPYETFEIISPKDQESIQNQSIIEVKIKVNPDLQKSDKIELVLDGKLVGEAVSDTHLKLNITERGLHQLSAIIIDESQRVIQKSNNITLNVHRNSVITSPAK